MSTGIKFDRSFNLGHLFQAGALLIGGVAAWVNLNSRVTTLEIETAGYDNLQTRVVILETTVGNINATLVQLYAAAQETNDRLNQVQVDLAGVAARLRAPTVADPTPF